MADHDPKALSIARPTGAVIGANRQETRSLITFVDDVMWPWLVFPADWSLRWAALICLVAVWLTIRPPRRTEIGFLLCWSVPAAGTAGVDE
jgi:hypothetical protein